LILIFVAATLLPLGVTVWIAARLLDHSLSLATGRELDDLSRSLEQTGRALYQTAGDLLKQEIAAGLRSADRYRAAQRESWPDYVEEFNISRDPERFLTAGDRGSTMVYLTRSGADVLAYSRPLGGPGMAALAAQHARAREAISRSAARNLRKGFTITFIIIAASAWLAALTALIYWAHRVSQPIRQLTAGLGQLADGNFQARLHPRRDDEVGAAMHAFNNTAGQLEQHRDRLVYLTRLASWQALARKMAHEVKNSLTPIRLTMEELVARRDDRDVRFLEQAAQIVIDEVRTLERRVRAFSDFGAEPPVRLAEINVNALLEERVALLKMAHPEVTYNTRLEADGAKAVADEDLVKGVLTNLLENAAQAAGGGGLVLGKTFCFNGKVGIEIHDSGPGLSLHARGTLFEPTISFKKAGMGLGLSIARRSTMLVGGDITLVEGELGGAGFRVLLPAASFQ
jgi:nitrogen fixation/metabolism regulation signal transduction histidine kinase